MALTFTNVIEGGLRDWTLRHGVRVAQFDMTSSDVSVDYSSGFDIAGNAAQMGFRKVFQVLGATLRASGGGLRLAAAAWDANTGKLRFLNGGGAGLPLEDVSADTADELQDNDVVRMVVMGV